MKTRKKEKYEKKYEKNLQICKYELQKDYEITNNNEKRNKKQ